MIESVEVREDPGFQTGSVASLSISFLLCTLTVCGFLIASGQTAHWFIIPVFFGGVLIGCDAVDWFRGRLHLFDPAGIIGMMGVHFFFLAPLLHVAWNSWMPYIEPPPDWRDWLGGMAIVNAVGLMLYRAVRKRAAVWGERTTKETFWQLDRRRFWVSAGCGLLLSSTLQAWVYAQHGGIAGYMESFSESIDDPMSPNGFIGMGWLFMLSESFPILAIISFATFAGRLRIARASLVLTLVLVGVFVLQMLFGGLRGSRSNTIWALFWAAGIIHLWVRPLTRKFIFTGVIFMVAFMYFYGFYKNMGQEALIALRHGARISDLSKKTGRTFDGLLLGDLGRSDIQAFLLYRLSMPTRDYQYALGRTYLGTAAILIPRALWPDRPPTKVKEGTEAQYGVGSWDEYTWSSSHVYGLAGEAMLNFGPVAVPFAYLIFGVMVGRVQYFLSKLRAGDTRLLLYPFVVMLCFSVLQSDSDNLLFILVKDGLVPTLVVLFGSRVLTYSRAEEAKPRAGLILPQAC